LTDASVRHVDAQKKVQTSGIPLLPAVVSDLQDLAEEFGVGF